MMRFYLLLSALWSTANAFSIVTNPTTKVRLSSSRLFAYPEKFARAIQCAENHGLCDVDELLQLADELEAYQQSGSDQKEEMDRLDVVEILRLQSKLQLRQEYLRDGNLFKEVVENQKQARAGRA